MKIVCPCHHCEERQVGCHAKCEKYATYQRKNIALRTAKAEYAEITDYTFKCKRRIKKKKENYHLGWNTGE